MNNSIESGSSNTFVLMSETDLENYSMRMIQKVKQELETTIAESKEDKLVSIKDAMSMLGVKRTTLWNWNRRGYLQIVAIGGKRMYRLSDVRAIIAGRN